jgi:hypothetical protein
MAENWADAMGMKSVVYLVVSSVVQMVCQWAEQWEHLTAGMWVVEKERKLVAQMV